MNAECKIVLAPGTKTGGIYFRGANRKLFSTHDSEVIISGPGDTGKTFACCMKVHLTCLKVAGSQCAIVRKTYASVHGSVLATFERVNKMSGGVASAMGGDRPYKYVYENGSAIWVGGMDNPERVLSSERDLIYVNQTEELTLNDWETLATRATGRGAVVKHAQLLGDCNPGGAKHWIRERAKAGKLVVNALGHSFHQLSVANELRACSKFAEIQNTPFVSYQSTSRIPDSSGTCIPWLDLIQAIS